MELQDIDKHVKISCISIITSNQQKKESRKQFNLQQHQTVKMTWNKFNQKVARLVHWKLLLIILLKDMKEDLNKQKDVNIQGMEINIVKMAILPKEIYRVNAISIEISMAYFQQMENQILKFICDFKGPIWPKRILKKNNKVRALKLMDSKFTTKLQ